MKLSSQQRCLLKSAYDDGLQQFSSAADKQKLLEVAVEAQLQPQQVKVNSVFFYVLSCVINLKTLLFLVFEKS